MLSKILCSRDIGSDLCSDVIQYDEVSFAKADSKRLETYHFNLLVRVETGFSISCEVTVDLDGVFVTTLVRIYPVVSYKVQMRKVEKRHQSSTTDVNINNTNDKPH